MDVFEGAEDAGVRISIARCRELLGDEAESMTDQDSRTSSGEHAETMAWILVEMYQDRRRTSRVEAVSRKRTLLVPAEWI